MLTVVLAECAGCKLTLTLAFGQPWVGLGTRAQSSVTTVVLAESVGCRPILMQTFWPAGLCFVFFLFSSSFFCVFLCFCFSLSLFLVPCFFFSYVFAFFCFLWLCFCVSSVFFLLVRCLSLLSFFVRFLKKLFVFAWNVVLRSLLPTFVLAESAGCKLTLMRALGLQRSGKD